MGVEAAGLRDHVQDDAFWPPVDESCVLFAEVGLGLGESDSKRGDPGDRHRSGLNLVEALNEVGSSIAQLLSAQFIRPSRGTTDEVRDTDATGKQPCLIFVREPQRGINEVIGQPRLVQGGPESVARSGEGRVDRGRPQSGVDPDDEHRQRSRQFGEDVVDGIGVLGGKSGEVMLRRLAASEWRWPAGADEIFLDHAFHITVEADGVESWTAEIESRGAHDLRA